VLVDRADRRAKNHAFLVEVLAAGLEPRSCKASNWFEEIDRPTRLPLPLCRGRQHRGYGSACLRLILVS
jgi:hypothetical protein